jgi:predicted GNAT family acetyltransferase
MHEEPGSTNPGQYTVSHEDQGNRGAFFIDQDGARVAEMTYRRGSESRILIDHTWVVERLRGKGVARSLLDAAVAWARHTGTRVSATCSYAVAQFALDRTISDVWEED